MLLWCCWLAGRETDIPTILLMCTHPHLAGVSCARGAFKEPAGRAPCISSMAPSLTVLSGWSNRRRSDRRRSDRCGVASMGRASVGRVRASAERERGLRENVGRAMAWAGREGGLGCSWHEQSKTRRIVLARACALTGVRVSSCALWGSVASVDI